jgi:5'-methylthioadenosine nucleosidase
MSFTQSKCTRSHTHKHILTHFLRRLSPLLVFLVISLSLTHTHTHSVLINIAMEAEATPFIEHLQLQKVPDYFPSHLPFVAYRGMYPKDNTTNALQVTVITNGKDNVYHTEACNVGTIAAATVTMMALQQEIPDIYINAGTAGGFQRHGATIGDIYVISSFTFHDRRIPIPGYDTYGIGKRSSTMNIDAIVQHYTSWKSGICTTGDSLDKTAECDVIMEQSQASVKDMEGAAIAWVVAMYSKQLTKFTSLKVITDIVDGTKPTHEEFLQNLHTASEQLQHAIPMMLDYIASKELKEL